MSDDSLGLLLDISMVNSEAAGGLETSQSQSQIHQSPCIGPCRKTYNEATRSVDMLECTSCQGWLCFQCLPYNKTEKKMLSKPEIQWICATCLKTPQQQHMTHMARLGSIKLKLDRALELFTTSFKTLSTQLEKKADKEVVESLSTKLSHVQLEVDELKSSQQHAVDKRLDSYVSELEAREDRKHNIIAFNIDESDSADGMTRKTEDMEQVNKIHFSNRCKS